MHRIIKKKRLNKEICLLEFEAPEIAKSASAGQFIIIRIDEPGERFPLTLFKWDEEKGSITVICQAIGLSTKKLCSLSKGDAVLDIAGPLGNATSLEGFGKVICIGGGVGTAEAYPIAEGISKAGGDVTGIIGSRTKELVICENLMRKVCRELYVTTDDGSYGEKGFVTDVLKQLIEKEEYDMVYAIGPVPMMRSVAHITRAKGLKTLVSLNSIMIDGTGMCGGCRVLYEGESKFSCIDGPEFDAHLIDFEDLSSRQSRYKTEEKQALDKHEGSCKIGLRGKDERTKS